MRYISFASGSSGNCALIRAGGTAFLLDAGISMKRIRACLADQGLTLGDLSGVLVTHEHSDHISGLAMLSKYTDLPFYMSGGTARALLRQRKCAGENLCTLEPGRPLRQGELEITAFETPHDAAESFGYRIEGENGALAVATDLGYVPPSIRSAVSGCKAAVVEANHDEMLLRQGPYPWALQRRILGNQGHLCNEVGAELAYFLAEAGADEILLAHLSKENNRPELAFEASRRLLGKQIRLHVAPADQYSVEIRI